MSDDEGDDDLSSVVKGKQGELIVIGKLLDRGHKVYLPMVDLGVDCLIDVGRGNYKEVQIKFREDEPTFRAKDFQPRDNFYFICFCRSRRGDDFWIIPSRLFKRTSKPAKIKNRDYRILQVGKEGSNSRTSFSGNYGKWDMLLAGASKDIRKIVTQASKRVEGEHLKQPDLEREVLTLLLYRGFQVPDVKPFRTKQIIDLLKEKLRDKFSTADLETTTVGGAPRWQKNAEFAIYQGLKKKGLIESKGKNQWFITEKGVETLKQYPELRVAEWVYKVRRFRSYEKSVVRPPQTTGGEV